MVYDELFARFGQLDVPEFQQELLIAQERRDYLAGQL